MYCRYMQGVFVRWPKVRTGIGEAERDTLSRGVGPVLNGT